MANSDFILATLRNLKSLYNYRRIKLSPVIAAVNAQYSVAKFLPLLFADWLYIFVSMVLKVSFRGFERLKESILASVHQPGPAHDKISTTHIHSCTMRVTQIFW
jgi:hypothetical protein